MSTIVPVREIDVSNLARLRIQCQNDIFQMSANKVGASNLVTRTIRPSDLVPGSVLGQLATPVLASNVYKGDVYNSVQLRVDQTFILYGITVLPGAGMGLLNELRFSAGPTALDIVSVDPIYSDINNATGYLFPPIAWESSENVVVDMLSAKGAAAGLIQYAWLGYVCEKSKITAPPRQLVVTAGAAPRVPGQIF